MQISPVKELLPYIKHYLFLESKGTRCKKLRLFSDGNMGMVFSFKNNLYDSSVKLGQLQFFPRSFFYGQISKFKDVYQINDTELIIVVFQPTGIKQLIGLPANEFGDTIIKSEYIFDKEAKELYEKLNDQFKIEDKIKLLNTFFLEKMFKKTMPDDILVRASINFIVKNKGLVTSHQLIKHTGYSERQIERKFIESVGINPKKFSTIIKLQTFLKELQNNDHNNFAAMAYYCGYSDQSHLIKEFKKYTGITPTEYVNKSHKLAVNFLDLNPLINSSQMSGLYNLPKKL